MYRKFTFTTNDDAVRYGNLQNWHFRFGWITRTARAFVNFRIARFLEFEDTLEEFLLFEIETDTIHEIDHVVVGARIQVD